MSQRAVSNYQCAGCTLGSSPKDGCFKKANFSSACQSHVAGTLMFPGGKILLGLPKGFNRVGPHEKMTVEIFKDHQEFIDSWGKGSSKTYNKFNVPVWKYKTEDGHVIVRGLSPRTNTPFLHVHLSSEIFDLLDCQEITKLDQEEMD